MRRLHLWACGAVLAGFLACGGDTDPAVRTVDLQQLASRVRAPGPRPLLLVFWATWCEPCIAEIPDLAALQTRHAHTLEVIGVSLDAFLHSPAQGQALVQAQLVQTPTPYENVVYVGAQDPLFTAFDLPGGIPYAVLYDRERRALHHFRGRVDPAWIDSLLAAATGGATR